MFERRRGASTPTSWLHVAGFVLVLWAVSSDTLAQIREVLVTEVRGNAVRAGNAAPLRALDTLKAGERVRLSTDSQLGLFNAAEAQLYVVDGPAEVSVGAKEVAANGKPVTPRNLHDAYRTIRAGSPELVQGSLVMRAGPGLRVLSPEGVVDARQARHFTWSPAPGSWRFELASESGELVYRAEAQGSGLALPEGVTLQAGTKYVWGISPAAGQAAPVDWTEFRVAENAPRPVESPSASERMIHAAWLRGQGLERAALRAASNAAR